MLIIVEEWGEGGGGAIYKNDWVSCCIFSEGDICVLVPTKIELTSVCCQYLFVLGGPWYLYTFALE